MLKTVLKHRKVRWINAGHQNHVLKPLFSVEHAEPRAQMFCKKHMKLNILPLGQRGSKIGSRELRELREAEPAPAFLSRVQLPMSKEEMDQPMGKKEMGQPMGKEEMGQLMGKKGMGQPMGKEEMGQPIGMNM